MRQQLRDCVTARRAAVDNLKWTNARMDRLDAAFARGRTAAATEQVEKQRQDRLVKLQQAEVAVQQAVAMERLVNCYVPACFEAGRLVRCCNWDGRRNGSGRYARQIMEFTAAVLLSVFGAKSVVNEQLRVLVLALLQWRDWNERLYGSVYS